MNLKMFGVVCAVSVLAACSGVSKPEGVQAPVTTEPGAYVVDGASYTPQKMKVLASTSKTLRYVATPEAFSKGMVHVFTDKAAYAAFKAQYSLEFDRALKPQTSCWTDLDKKTSLYKGSGYGGSVLKLVKGSSYNSTALGSFNQSISSVKGACSVWTDLYDASNYTGTVWSTFGNNFTGLPSWIDNDASSVGVGN